MPATDDKPLVPPEETLWQKYSPHFELPLAGATSCFLHGLVIGLLAMGGIALFFVGDVEATKPPSMDVVMLEGGGGGFEGGGSEAGLPGPKEAGGPKRTENVTPIDFKERTEFKQPPRLSKDPPLELGLPIIDDGSTPANSELAIELAKIAKEAEEQIRMEMKLLPLVGEGPGKKPGTAGTDSPKGKGGQDGGGDGPGKGSKKGPGTGKGGLGGAKPTAQEVFAWRWHFDLSGDGKEHARKLAAIGVTVAFPDPRGGFLVVKDLNRRPAAIEKDSLAAFKDAVKWYNTKPDSIQGLASELRLPFSPKFIVLLLPKDREQKMAQEEARFAKEQGKRLDQVRRTWFDFRLQNGVYDPVGLRLE